MADDSTYRVLVELRDRNEVNGLFRTSGKPPNVADVIEVEDEVSGEGRRARVTGFVEGDEFPIRATELAPDEEA